MNKPFSLLLGTNVLLLGASMLVSTSTAAAPVEEVLQQVAVATPVTAKTVPASATPAKLDKVLPAKSAALKLPKLGNEGLVLKSGVQAHAHEITLTVDKAEIVNLKAPISRVAISQSEVASVTVIHPTQIQLVGKRPGVASLILWDEAGARDYTTIDVLVQRDVSALAKQLRMIDPNIDIQPMAAEDSVVLNGEVDSNDKAQLAVELAKAFFDGSNGAATAATSNTPTSTDLNSQAPGSTLPRSATHVINLIKVKGQPTTKLELVRGKLQLLDPNIQLDIVPGPNGVEKAILSGRVTNAGVVSAAVNLASVFYGQPGMKVLTGPGGNLVRPTGSATFQGEGAFSDNMDINVLQGSVITDASGNVVSMLKVSQKPQVRCTIKFLDISRTDLRQLGATLTGTSSDVGFGHLSGAQGVLRNFANLNGKIDGNDSGMGWVTGNGTGISPYTGGVNALAQTLGSGTTQVLSINQNLAMAMSAFIEKRKIHSLAEPTLTMLSGEKASFLAGGELPIPISGINGQISVTFKEFGIRLNLIPTVTEDGKIHMQVAPEVSTVDPANAVVTNGIAIPGLKTRRMQTTLELENRQTIILAGLYNKEETDTVSRFPGLGSVPVLGNFFRQKNGNRLDNEMLVIITPEVVATPTEAANSSDFNRMNGEADDRQQTTQPGPSVGLAVQE